MAADQVPFYRWPDGSLASLQRVDVVARTSTWSPSAPTWVKGKAVVGEEFKIVVSDLSSREKVTIYPFFDKIVRMSVRGHDPKALDRIDGTFRRRLLGMFLDLGIERPRTTAGGLLGTDSSRTYLRYPKFIDDERFLSRYSEASGMLDDVPRTFLGCVDHLRIQRMGRRGQPPSFQASWHNDDLPPRNKAKVFSKKSQIRSSVDRLVDEIVTSEDIRPESEREAYIASEVDFGENLLWTKVEAEVYQLLGDPLPVFWEPEKLRAWLEERTP